MKKIWLVSTLLKFHLQGGGVLTSNWAHVLLAYCLYQQHRRRYYTRVPVHVSHFINLYTGLAQKIKAILFSKHRRGYKYVYMASVQSVELSL